MSIKGYRASDQSDHPIRIDQSTNTLQGIDYAHHEVHAGSHFEYSDLITLGLGATQDYIITTPNTAKWAHMVFELWGSAITTFELFEATARAGIALQSVFNSNRNSANLPTTTVHKGSGAGADGTRILVLGGGSASGQFRGGTSHGNGEEIILRANTKYILRVTSGTAANNICLAMEWYEHTNIA